MNQSAASWVKAHASLDRSLHTPDVPDFLFTGKHLIASYMGCNQEVLNNEGLLAAMARAVAAAGATILKQSDYVFDNGAITAVMLLSESHASIHTYPEHSAAFVDLFTCGHVCDPAAFHQVMVDHLQPKTISHKILVRHSEIEDSGMAL